MILVTATVGLIDESNLKPDDVLIHRAHVRREHYKHVLEQCDFTPLTGNAVSRLQQMPRGQQWATIGARPAFYLAENGAVENGCNGSLS